MFNAQDRVQSAEKLHAGEWSSKSYSMQNLKPGI